MDTITEALIRTRRGTFLMLEVKSSATTHHVISQGTLKTVDVDNRKVSLESTVYEGQIDDVPIDGIVSINDFSVYEPFEGSDFRQLSGSTGWTGEAWLNPSGSALGQESDSRFSRIPEGKYLMISGFFGEAKSVTVKQGKLKTVDYEDNKVTLESTAYPGQFLEVPMDKIISVDDTRTSSGAKEAVQQADWQWTGNEWRRTQYRS
jgi:Cu/Ag efflux protein CusF